MVRERKPPEARLVPRDYVPLGSICHHVVTGESLSSLAESVGLTWQELAEYNWLTSRPPEVNWYIRRYVGSNTLAPDGFNYSFRTNDTPGIVFLPQVPVDRHGAARRRKNEGHTTLRRLLLPTLVLRIPLGRSRKLSMARVTVGKIYVPTRYGGRLTVQTTAGKLQLFYKNGQDMDPVTLEDIKGGQYAITSPSPLVSYDVPKDKHGWYFVRVIETSGSDVSNEFMQEAQAQQRPWNGWYCPTEPNTNPNIYEEEGSFVPLKKYDQLYGTRTREWEARNHVGQWGWEGHCWGWSLASIAKRNPNEGSRGFTKWEIRALYTELADNAPAGWRWVIGTPTNPIPSGPVSEAEGEDPDQWVKRFHDGLRKWIREQRRALTVNLRNDRVLVKWKSDQYMIPGIELLGANANSGDNSGFITTLTWDKLAGTLQFHNGSPMAVSGDSMAFLESSIGTLIVQITRADLPTTSRTEKVYLSTEIWNHAIFRYVAHFREVEDEGDEKYIEIEMIVYGNRDTGDGDIPFPPENDSVVDRHYTYRLTYDGTGETTDVRSNWIDCHGALPPSAFGLVEDEGVFVWRSNCGIRKPNVDAI